MDVIVVDGRHWSADAGEGASAGRPAPVLCRHHDGRPLAVPLCGDDARALETVRRLVRDLGCEPLGGGGLDRAALLEATAALLIGLWVGEGADAQAIAPPMAHAGAR